LRGQPRGCAHRGCRRGERNRARPLGLDRHSGRPPVIDPGVRILAWTLPSPRQAELLRDRLAQHLRWRCCTGIVEGRCARGAAGLRAAVAGQLAALPPLEEPPSLERLALELGAEPRAVDEVLVGRLMVWLRTGA